MEMTFRSGGSQPPALLQARRPFGVSDACDAITHVMPVSAPG